MELKEFYKNNKAFAHVKGRVVEIENDKSKFDLYKRLKLDVFKDVKNDKPSKKSNKQ